jgi:acetolactate synthase-1/2/3 large subunit
MKTDVCVHADAGVFLGRLLACADAVRRPADQHLVARIKHLKAETERHLHHVPPGKCGVDPLAVVASLRRNMPEDGLLFTDVTVSEHLAAEYHLARRPRTFFNPVDNQAMGWSVPAAIGAQRVHHGRTVATLTGDGCLLMSAMEITTAARESLPVKFFVLDDQAYHYMQMLQLPAYLRTTATILARMDYAAMAQTFGVAYQEVLTQAELDAKVRGALAHPGPVLVRIATDYGEREVRWVEAVRKRYTDELTAAQKARFLARIGARAVRPAQRQND